MSKDITITPVGWRLLSVICAFIGLNNVVAIQIPDPLLNTIAVALIGGTGGYFTFALWRKGDKPKAGVDP